MIISIRMVLLLVLFLGIGPRVRAQGSELDDTTVAAGIGRANRWIGAASFHVARLDLEPLIHSRLSSENYRNVLLLLVTSDYEDKEFAEAYERSGEFLEKYPFDPACEELRYIHGVSAFHSGHSKIADQTLSEYLLHAKKSKHSADAYYWRAMSRLDLGDQEGAQADLESCTNDPAGGIRRDVALMGFALSLERKRDFAASGELLEQLLREFPDSKLRTDAQIRLASVSLHLDLSRRAVDVLSETRPGTSSQREEYILLLAGAEFRLQHFDRAEAEYTLFTKEFDDSPHLRKARYGLAWSMLKRGNSTGARKEFDSLATGKDTLAYAAMYQSGVLALLDGNSNLALARFDTLVEKTPYDRYVDQSYYEMGLIRYRTKLYKEARHDFQLGARLYPESPLCIDAFHMMGQSSMALRDFSNAQYAFAQVRKLKGKGIVLANATFQEGVALYHLGRFRTCTERFGDFLQKFPGDSRIPEALVWKGEALYQDGKYDESERAYAEALKLLGESPKREEAVYGYAWTLFEQKKFSQAASAFDRFTASYANSPRALEVSLRKADCYFFLGQYDKSSALYETLVSAKTESKNVEYAAFQLAMSYIQRGETDRGIEYLRNFLVSHPSSIYAEVVQFNIGWTYFSREEYAPAITEFHLLEKRFPESQLMPRVLFNTGDAFFNLKSYDSALVYYQRVIREYAASPLMADALAGVQYTFEAQGKPQRALAEIDTILAKKPEGISREELFSRKGDILFGQGDFAGAIKEFRQLLTLKPSAAVQSKTYYQLGRSFELQNDPSTAVQNYEKVLSDFPDSEFAPTASLALGIARMKMKQYAAAVKSLQNFDERYPDSPLRTEAHYQLGLALLNVPDRERAVAEFQLVIQSAPDNIFADRSRLQIARVHQERKEYSSSFDTLNVLLSRRSDDLAAEALLMIGENYAAQRKYREALQSFNDVIQQYTDYPLQVEKARFGLGTTYEKMKDRKQARLHYQEIIKSPVDQAMKRDAELHLKKLK